MAHTDRKPTDEVFKDIRGAATRVWMMQDFHWDYVTEKIEQRAGTPNYADNWSGFIQQFDEKNQILFFEFLKLQESVNFLVKQQQHYGYFVPRTKK
jgi:hypothetical protein